MTAHWERTGKQKISRKLATALGIKPGDYKIGPAPAEPAAKARKPRPSGPIRDAGAHPDIEIPAEGDAAGAARRRGASSPSAAWSGVWSGVCRRWRWIEDSLVGDAIGGACLAVTIIVLTIIAGVM